MSRKQGIWRQMLAVFACMMLLSGSLAGAVSAQDPEPTADPAQLVDPTLPQETTPEATEPVEEPEATEPKDEEVDESTPEADSPPPSAGAQRVDPATTPGAPASLAHGLAYYDGDDLVWQAQEIEVPVISEADSFVSDAAIIVQRDGQSIIRNNTTGKRALLTPGEAFFITTEDSFTLMADDDGATVWKYTLVDPDDVASNAFYESPTLTSVRDNTYDFRLVRYVLNQGETADLPANEGAGLLMPGAGEVQVDHGGQLSLLGLDGNQGQGQVLRQPTSISNTGSEPTVVYYLYLGETVSNESSAPRQSTTTTSESSTAAPSTDTGEVDSSDTGSSEPGGDVTTPSDQPADGPYLAQINIYAEAELWLSVSVDGVLWFDGTLPAGQWSGPMNGSVFEVYTSSGVNTLFENACGTQFYMGQAPGEEWYTLAADASSCPPPGE